MCVASWGMAPRRRSMQHLSEFGLLETEYSMYCYNTYINILQDVTSSNIWVLLLYHAQQVPFLQLSHTSAISPKSATVLSAAMSLLFSEMYTLTIAICKKILM